MNIQEKIYYETFSNFNISDHLQISNPISARNKSKIFCSAVGQELL